MTHLLQAQELITNAAFRKMKNEGSITAFQLG